METHKLRCAVLDDYQSVALVVADWSPILDRIDVTALREHLESDEHAARTLAGHAIIVVMRERTSFGAALFERLPALKLLVTTGMRNAAIDLTAAAARGVVVCGTASSSEPPAELTWALLLGLARHIVAESHAFRTGGPWQSTVGSDLHGKTLGLLGLGKIGARVARIGAAFGMHVLAWSPNLTPERAAAGGAALATSKEMLLERSDFVSVHLVLGERTRGLLGAAELRRMRPTACLINTSRAAIVDQEALVAALQGGWIAGAGIDVFDEEPLPAEHPLRTAPNLLATPHLGYVTQDNYRTYFREAVENIAAFLDGTPMRRLA